MKSLTRFTLRLCSAAVLLPVIFLPDANGAEERWRPFGKSETDTQWYIDTETLHRDAAGRVVAWIKSVPDSSAASAPAGQETTRGIVKEIQQRYFADYGYTEGLWEIDCAGNTSRLFYFCAYTADGELLPASVTADLRQLPLFPGGVGETIREAVCSK